jgi:hypothetical protein
LERRQLQDNAFKGFLDWAWADVASKPANTGGGGDFCDQVDIWASLEIS